MVDYDNLQAQYNKLDIKALESGITTATQAVAPTCKSSLIVSSGFTNKFILPSPPSGAQSMIDNGLEKPNNGKLIDVSETQVAQAVYSSNRRKLQNLAIKKLADDESNTPNGSDTSDSAPTLSSSAAQPTSTKKNAASRQEGSVMGASISLSVLLSLLSPF